MELTDILKTALEKLPIIGEAIALNQAIFPLAFSLGYTGACNLLPSAIEVPQDFFHNLDALLPINFRAIDYLNIANSIVHASSDEARNCLDFSFNTFEIYIKLSKINMRRDLKDKIRICFGFPIDKMPRGHAWLEVEIGSRMQEYETTKYTPPFIETEEIMPYSDQTLKEKQQLNGKFRPYVVSLRGRRIFYPTPGSLLYLGGTLGLFVGQTAKAVLGSPLPK